MVKPKQPKPGNPMDSGIPPAASDSDTQITTLLQVSETLRTHSLQFDKLLQAIIDTKSSIEGKIDAVVMEVTLLRADHRNNTELALKTVQPEVASMRTKIQQMEMELMQLQRIAEDAEGRYRRNIIRFLGIPEQTESPNAEEFLENS
ncbi:hypothetical protein NDU88_002606 [Pleurodeles waltl]|uniref:Uncharacterized protein n=1 Tax=Pleurodeles waltl TaxID=8319 RepID=A0AAV7VF08_PLEWA|nr:hypothetical protein NDU88_002606 [Pleurodeles waltl]